MVKQIFVKLSIYFQLTYSRCTKLRVEWDMPFNQLQGVTVEDTGVRFSSKGGREYDHFVLVPKESKMWFFKEIEKSVLHIVGNVFSC